MLLGPQRRARRRLGRDLTLVGLGLVSVCLAVWMQFGDHKAADVATIASLAVGVAALALALVDFFRQEPVPPDPAGYADDLAHILRAQWLEEAGARRLRDPQVLPLAWATTTRPVAGELRDPVTGGRVLRVHLDGRLDGRFDRVISQLAQGFDQLPQNRLVVIGEPGSGKTVLAMLLTLGLLGARQPGGPVPVLLPVSTWDPVREPLDDWLVRTLAVPYYSGREEIPRALLAHGLLLPVLDGLDEIPESARRTAIRGINQAIGGERPVVVTCRAVEYEELIHGGAPTLRQAPVVEVAPVPPRDVIAYLRAVDWPEHVATGWGRVFDRLRTEPDGPLAEALSTPLMVTTARLVYQRGCGDPAELLDRERFDCRYAVEDHLTHRVLDAVYGPDPGLPDGAETRGLWDPVRARRWLTFLARHLHDHRERDLEWWAMSGRVLPLWVGPAVSFGLGLVLAVGAILWTAVTRGFAAGVSGEAVLVPMCIGAVFALISSLIWYAAGNRPPGRLSFSLRGSAGRLWRGFRLGVLVGAVAVVPVVGGMCVFQVLAFTPGPGSLPAAGIVSESLTMCVTLSLVVGVALATHHWLNAPPSRATQATPFNSYVQDRRSAVAGAAVAGLVVGGAGLFGLHVGQLVGDLVFRTLTEWPGSPGTGDVSDSAEVSWRRINEALGPDSHGWGLPFVLPGVAFALFVLLSRAWFRFLLVRLWLAVTGRMPWRFFAFLGEARRREIVRQANSAFQFRHIRLQEGLAGEPVYVRGPDSGARGTVPRRLLLGVGAAGVVGGTVAFVGRHAAEGEVVYWDRNEAWMTAVAFHPRTGELVWGASDGRVWRGGRREEERMVLPAAPYYDTLRGVDQLMFDARGDRLVVARDGLLAVGMTGRSHWSFRQGPAALEGRLSLSEDGRILAGGSGGRLALWDLDGAGWPTRIEVNAREQREIVTWDMCGDALVALKSTGRLVRIRVPDMTEEPVSTPVVDVIAGYVNSFHLMVSRRGDHLFLEGDGIVGRLWRMNDRTGRWEKSGPELSDVSVVFHPSKPLAAVSRTDAMDGDERTLDGTIELWSTDGTPARRKALRGHLGQVHAMSFSADGTGLASAGADGTVRRWDVSHLP
ncbi:NACHT domain-containing protein [Streptomyces brasiliscabiei]|uniref:NACHT domain-containing protein n=1 Tax=Streptomyces brasiliscabiei TaxID=2736302 RepID=UPI001C1262B6|nr:NACHT domain-containing protein [Streptomyces brasiliscabiei]